MKHLTVLVSVNFDRDLKPENAKAVLDRFSRMVPVMIEGGLEPAQEDADVEAGISGDEYHWNVGMALQQQIQVAYDRENDDS